MLILQPEAAELQKIDHGSTALLVFEGQFYAEGISFPKRSYPRIQPNLEEEYHQANIPYFLIDMGEYYTVWHGVEAPKPAVTPLQIPYPNLRSAQPHLAQPETLPPDKHPQTPEPQSPNQVNPPTPQAASPVEVKAENVEHHNPPKDPATADQPPASAPALKYRGAVIEPPANPSLVQTLSPEESEQTVPRESQEAKKSEPGENSPPRPPHQRKYRGSSY